MGFFSLAFSLQAQTHQRLGYLSKVLCPLHYLLLTPQICSYRSLIVTIVTVISFFHPLLGILLGNKGQHHTPDPPSHPPCPAGRQITGVSRDIVTSQFHRPHTPR